MENRRVVERMRKLENEKICKFSKKALQFLTTKKEAGCMPNVHYKKDCATSIILSFM
jgi:hypothetical protein